jgi:alpha-ketoglutarate-dependent taurine dioxygenase
VITGGKAVSIATEVQQNGYALLPALEPHFSGEEVAALIGSQVALGLGPAVHRLIPHARIETTPNTYSGLFGYEPFPFHTDLAHWRRPPRYLLLRCVVGYTEVETLVIDGSVIVQSVGAHKLSRALVRPRRPVAGSLSLLRLYQQLDDNQSLVRWDQTYIQPASDAGREGFESFKQALAALTPISISLASVGDTVVLDNWRMLHARGAVPVFCRNRLIERAYLEHVN